MRVMNKNKSLFESIQENLKENEVLNESSIRDLDVKDYSNVDEYELYELGMYMQDELRKSGLENTNILDRLIGSTLDSIDRANRKGAGYGSRSYKKLIEYINDAKDLLSKKESSIYEEFVPNNAGLHCPKCNSNLYYEVDDSEYPDGTQEYHYECEKCGYKSNIDEIDLNESDDEDEFESYSDFSDGDIILDVINNYTKITGEDIKDVFNYDKDVEGFFNQETIDRTGSKIIEYWKEKGLDRDRIDDLLYALDDELQSRWSTYVECDEADNKEVLLGNDVPVEKIGENGEKMVEHDSTVKVFKPTDTERDYTIVDITELAEITEGDVKPPIDVAELLTEVDSRLTESYGNWGTINIQSTRCNKDTNESNALFELNVGKDTYLMSMLLEENCTVLKVNNTNGKTIFKKKSKDIVGLAESYIEQFLKNNDVPECIKHINERLFEKLAFIKSYIEMTKLAPKEEKDEFKSYIEKEIYAFVAEVSDEIKANEPTDEDKLELPTFDKMVEEIFGKEWVKEDKEEPKEVEGAETLKESSFYGTKKEILEKYPELKDKSEFVNTYADDDFMAVDLNDDGSIKGYRLASKEELSEADEVEENPAEEIDSKPSEEPKTGLGTGYAPFVRKPKNIEALENKSNYFTDGDASYLICKQQSLSKDEFDKLQEDFLKDNEYCKSFEPLDTDNYSYNVIEFTCPDYDYKLLVDPSGFSYCRYVAKV